MADKPVRVTDLDSDTRKRLQRMLVEEPVVQVPANAPIYGSKVKRPKGMEQCRVCGNWMPPTRMQKHVERKH